MKVLHQPPISEWHGNPPNRKRIRSHFSTGAEKTMRLAIGMLFVFALYGLVQDISNINIVRGSQELLSSATAQVIVFGDPSELPLAKHRLSFDSSAAKQDELQQQQQQQQQQPQQQENVKNQQTTRQLMGGISKQPQLVSTADALQFEKIKDATNENWMTKPTSVQDDSSANTLNSNINFQSIDSNNNNEVSNQASILDGFNDHDSNEPDKTETMGHVDIDLELSFRESKQFGIEHSEKQSNVHKEQNEEFQKGQQHQQQQQVDEVSSLNSAHDPISDENTEPSSSKVVHSQDELSEPNVDTNHADWTLDHAVAALENVVDNRDVVTFTPNIYPAHSVRTDSYSVTEDTSFNTQDDIIGTDNDDVSETYQISQEREERNMVIGNIELQYKDESNSISNIDNNNNNNNSNSKNNNNNNNNKHVENPEHDHLTSPPLVTDPVESDRFCRDEQTIADCKSNAKNCHWSSDMQIQGFFCLNTNDVGEQAATHNADTDLNNFPNVADEQIPASTYIVEGDADEEMDKEESAHEEGELVQIETSPAVDWNGVVSCRRVKHRKLCVEPRCIWRYPTKYRLGSFCFSSQATLDALRAGKFPPGPEPITDPTHSSSVLKEDKRQSPPSAFEPHTLTLFPTASFEEEMKQDATTIVCSDIHYASRCKAHQGCIWHMLRTSFRRSSRYLCRPISTARQSTVAPNTNEVSSQVGIDAVLEQVDDVLTDTNRDPGFILHTQHEQLDPVDERKNELEQMFLKFTNGVYKQLRQGAVVRRAGTVFGKSGVDERALVVLAQRSKNNNNIKHNNNNNNNNGQDKVNEQLADEVGSVTNDGDEIDTNIADKEEEDKEEEEQQQEEEEEEEELLRATSGFTWRDSLQNKHCSNHKECLTHSQVSSLISGLSRPGLRYSHRACCRFHPDIRIMAHAIAEHFQTIGFSNWWMDGDLLDAMVLFKGHIPPWTQAGAAQISFAIDKGSGASSTAPMRTYRKKYISNMLRFNNAAKYLPYVLKVCTKKFIPVSSYGSKGGVATFARAAAGEQKQTTSDINEESTDSLTNWTPTNSIPSEKGNTGGIRCVLYSKATAIPKDRIIVKFELSHMDEDEGAKLSIVPTVVGNSCLEPLAPSLAPKDAIKDIGPIPREWILPPTLCKHSFYGRKMNCPAKMDLYKDVLSGPELRWRDHWWMNGKFREYGVGDAKDAQQTPTSGFNGSQLQEVAWDHCEPRLGVDLVHTAAKRRRRGGHSAAVG